MFPLPRKLLEQSPLVEAVTDKQGQLLVTLRPGSDDYSELSSLLVSAGHKLKLFREEEFNLESAFMMLTQGIRDRRSEITLPL